MALAPHCIGYHSFTFTFTSWLIGAFDLLHFLFKLFALRAASFCCTMCTSLLGFSSTLSSSLSISSSSTRAGTQNVQNKGFFTVRTSQYVYINSWRQLSSSTLVWTLFKQIQLKFLPTSHRERRHFYLILILERMNGEWLQLKRVQSTKLFALYCPPLLIRNRHFQSQLLRSG